jgi:fluoride exporter
MPVVLAVAAGGSFGALARYGLDALIERHVDSLFPWSTFVINVSGCFLNGLAVAFVVDALGAPA